MQEGWVPSEDTLVSLLEKYPEVDLMKAAKDCREWFLDKPTIRRAGWDRSFVRWVETGVKRGDIPLKAGARRPGNFGSTNDDKVRGWMELGIAESE